MLTAIPAHHFEISIFFVLCDLDRGKPLLKQGKSFFLGSAALGNLVDMPEQQSACKDGQSYQYWPKGQVSAYESRLTASQPREEEGLIGSGIKMTHKL